MPIDLLNTTYPIDYTGKLLSNKITGEQQILTAANFRDYHFIVPTLAPFFAESLKMSFRAINGTVRPLVAGVDYYCTHPFIAASRACASPIFGSISMLDTQLAGVVTLSEYQTLGGIWTQDEAKIAEILADRLHNPRITAWDVVTDMPVTFPPVDHEWDLQDLVGMNELSAKLSQIAVTLQQNQINGFSAHVNAINPHRVTAAQVGTYSSAQLDLMFAGLSARIDSLTPH